MHRHRLPSRNRALAAALGAALPVCLGLSACRRQAAQPDWNSVLKPIQEKYAPDARLSVFHVKVNSGKAGFVAEGEVENAEAKSEVLRRVSEVSNAAVTDRVRVLPDPALGPKDRGPVIVSVGNVRHEPAYASELVTQVLLGSVLRLLEQRGGWYRIQCPDRYIGWIDSDAVVRMDTAAAGEWEDSERLVATAQFDLLRSRPSFSGAVVCDVVAGDLLRLVAERGAWYEAALPDGRSGFIVRSGAERYGLWRASRRFTPENIEATARSFMGVPYLWGGTSAKGFDCSGFVKTVFLLNGVQLLRDADQQAGLGAEVDPGADVGGLHRGDLLFFGRKAAVGKPERIVHVAIYLADRQFIHCSGRVRVSSLDPASPDYDEWHAKQFVRARRFAFPSGR